MTGKCLGFFMATILFSGCELLPQLNEKVKIDESTKVGPVSQPICLWKKNENTQPNDCNLEYWVRFWAKNGAKRWSERQKQIEMLSNHDRDMFVKILLSQSKDTPYQDRLRAQIWAESLMPKLSSDMEEFIKVTLYQPSLEVLEMESALVTLSKANTRQQQKIEQQTLLLNKQAGQIEQLLNIETSIIDSNQRNNK